MTYTAIVDTVPPTITPKSLYASSLFNTATGVYGASVPSSANLAVSGGNLQLYEGSQLVIATGGYIQATLSGLSVPSGGYWAGLYTVLNASDRSIVVQHQAVKGSQGYAFAPATAPPLYTLISTIYYTDSSGFPYFTGGNDQKYHLATGNYIVVLESYTVYTQTMPHTDTAGAFFSSVTTLKGTESTVTVTNGATVTAAFTA